MNSVNDKLADEEELLENEDRVYNRLIMII